jgi:hypothetical protein
VQVEHVLEALIRDAEEAGDELIEMFGEEDDGALPAHVLDGDFGLLRHKMLHSRVTGRCKDACVRGALAHTAPASICVRCD